jgi:hypothetical protein
MLYKDLVHVPGTIQGDGIHPTAKGSAIIAGTLFPVLKPLLAQNTVSSFAAKIKEPGLFPAPGIQRS